MTSKKTVYVDDIMQRLKEEVKTHPDPRLRDFLRVMLLTERGQSVLAAILMAFAEENGVEVKEREGME